VVSEQVIELKDHEISLMEGRVRELLGRLAEYCGWQQKEMVRSSMEPEQRAFKI
jgi:hypothetical protein